MTNVEQDKRKCIECGIEKELTEYGRKSKIRCRLCTNKRHSSTLKIQKLQMELEESRKKEKILQELNTRLVEQLLYFNELFNNQQLPSL